MAEPRGMIAPPRQPIGWPTHKFQHSLKTVMPSQASGTSMTMHRNIPKEILPNARYNHLPERWRAQILPPIHYKQQSQAKTGLYLEPSRPGDAAHPRGSTSRSAHLDIRPPSAYSTSIVLKPQTAADFWTVNSKLDTARIRAVMRENTFLPGNFSTLYKCSKNKVENMVNRLSYDPYERREQLILTDNPEGDADTPMYSRQDIDIIVKRLAAVKSSVTPEAEPEKKPLSKELTAKEKEIVDRLSKYEHPADRKVEVAEEEKKTVTKEELEKILERLTKQNERKEPVVQQVEVKKVSAVDMDNILTRLTTYDSLKWPPESKPEIFKQHEN